MQPNYNEEYRKQQENYQRSRNPFEYGQQVAQRRYSEIMANLDARRQATQQSYGDMYQAARQRAVKGQAAGGPLLSGGMAQQQKDYISAIEMQEMGRIGTAQNQALQDLYAQGQAAFSNAQLEGQQATQMELQNRTAELQLVQQKQAIMNDTKLSKEEKEQQIAALEGGLVKDEELKRSPISLVEAGGIAATFGIPATIAGTAVAKSGATLKTLAGLAGAGKVSAVGVSATGATAVFGAEGAKAALLEIGKNATIASKGLGASFAMGLKSWAVKLGLAKGAVAVKTVAGAKVASLALTGLGPVGWGILAIGLGAAAIAGISALSNR
jgi:hypothetical protein